MHSQMTIVWLVELWGHAYLSDRRALDGVTGVAYMSCTMPRTHDRDLRKESLQDDRYDAWVLNYMLGKHGN